MWVGTQNGLARYEGGSRFHRFPLPSDNENIVSIEEDRQGIIVSNGKRWFIVKDGEAKPTNQNYSTSKQTSTTLLSELVIPQASQILKKPQELISTIFKDAGGNIWVGYRNAGYQVISRNAVLYSLANQNPLSEATQGMDILASPRQDRRFLPAPLYASSSTTHRSNNKTIPTTKTFLKTQLPTSKPSSTSSTWGKRMYVLSATMRLYAPTFHLVSYP